MQPLVRRSVGIDIAKATFTACICTSDSACKVQMSEVVQFENGKRGFNQLLKWVRKNKVPITEPVFLMEATGIYYEPLAYHLHKLSAPVAVVLPNKVKHYAKSLNVKSKTDVIDARLTSPNGGAERSLELWQPPAPIFKNLRAITRLYRDLKDQRTAFENRLHSTKAGEEPLAYILQSTKSIITKLDREIEKCAE
jgi:transposase